MAQELPISTPPVHSVTEVIGLAKGFFFGQWSVNRFRILATIAHYFRQLRIILDYYGLGAISDYFGFGATSDYFS